MCVGESVLISSLLVDSSTHTYIHTYIDMYMGYIVHPVVVAWTCLWQLAVLFVHLYLALVALLLPLPASPRCPAFIINMLPAFVYDAFALFLFVIFGKVFALSRLLLLARFTVCFASCWRHKLFLLTHKNC